MRVIWRFAAWGSGLVLLAVLGGLSLGDGKVEATHMPANKVVAMGSTIQFLRTTPNDALDAERVLFGRLRTSKPTDLILSLSSECALWTSTATENQGTSADASETRARVLFYITIDGRRIPVTRTNTVAGTPDEGTVVFCDRAHRMETEFVNPEDDDDPSDTLRIREFLRTRSANAFNWITLNTGSGIHTIEVWAVLDAGVVEQGNISAVHPDVGAPAAAGIGARTLIVHPEKLANDASF